MIGSEYIIGAGSYTRNTHVPFLDVGLVVEWIGRYSGPEEGMGV